MGTYRRTKRFLSGFSVPVVDDFPVNPFPGMPVVKGNMFYVSIEGPEGNLIWYPAVRNTEAATFDMPENSKVWEFPHNLGPHVVSTPYDENGKAFLKGDVRKIENVVNENGIGHVIKVTFKNNKKGHLIMFGMTSGISATEVAPLTASAGEVETAFMTAELKIDAEAEQLRTSFLSAGAGQMLEYQATSEELMRYNADPDPQPENYPFLNAEVGLLGETLDDVAIATQGTVDGWKTMGSAIKHIRRVAKENLKVARDAGDIEGIQAASIVDWSQLLG